MPYRYYLHQNRHYPQKEADRDISKLLDTPAAVRFLSIEPLLSAMDLTRWLEAAGLDTVLGLSCPGIDWVIVGGESGPTGQACR